MNKHEKIDYLEFPSTDLAATKTFFSSVFAWHFTDYGPEYTAFDKQGLEGGFFLSTKISLTEQGSSLAVFYTDDIDATMSKVVAAGAEIIKLIFEFPGGRRFHFTEPGGSEFAVWSKT